jgi:DNA polymerase III epsilon subunit-like protein
MVKAKQQFDVVGIDFFKFIVQKVHEYENDKERIVTNYIFVAHNGRIFDVPFLFACIQRYAVTILYGGNRTSFGATITTAKRRQ